MEIQIADNIRKLRKEHSMTQEQLAEALGVTVGAVYKWESKQSYPEIKLLVEMAELFETSVDVILGYGWENGTMGQTAKKIKEFAVERKLEEGIRYAERSMQKYPNSFEIIYQSAELYFLSMKSKHAKRAIDLYNEALRLIEQNPYEDINVVVIENRIAMCYCYIDKIDEAIKLLKKNNINRTNDAKIGQLLAQNKDKAKEALLFLSDGLSGCYSTFYNICIGYTDAYISLGEHEKIKELLHILYEFGQGLRDTSKPTYMDRGDVKIFVILSVVSAIQGDNQSAFDYLNKAKEIAERFDKNPNYSLMGEKFYYSTTPALAYDDMGETAMQIIENSVKDEEHKKYLQPLWEAICNVKDKKRAKD